MAHTCNLTCLEGRDGEDHNSRPAQAKSSQDSSQPMAECGRMCLLSQLRRVAQTGGSQCKQPGPKARSSLENNQHKRVGGMTPT
jgi:hypothetical protein